MYTGLFGYLLTMKTRIKEPNARFVVSNCMENPKVYSQLSAGMRISVTPRFMAEESKPDTGRFIFSYQVTITNNRNHSVKLLNRHWYIYESILIQREVKGEGVVGLQPEIVPGESFQYSSWCPINCPIGKMLGRYEFEDLVTTEHFFVDIPEFVLIADYILN